MCLLRRPRQVRDFILVILVVIVACGVMTWYWLMIAKMLGLL